MIELRGDSAGAFTDGFAFVPGSNGSLLRGMVINRFTAHGVFINANSVKIQSNYIGTDSTGAVDFGNGGTGVFLNIASSNVVGTDGDGVNDAAEGNLISGNNAYGVFFAGDSNSNVIAGNLIGTNAAGTSAIGNSTGGISFFNDFLADGNRIGTNADGTSDALERNVISGNLNYGLVDFGNTTLIAGNYVGVASNGSSPLPNIQGGVSLGGVSATVGGTSAAARNVISGNSGFGVAISTSSATSNVVLGNYIGTDSGGTVAVPNTTVGVSIQSGASGNTIGGSTAAARNIISGNSGNGVTIAGTNTSGNVIAGNYIGVDQSGNTKLANTGYGVLVNASGTSLNTIGGLTGTVGNPAPGTGLGNVISGNGIYQIFLTTPGQTVQGNVVGLGADGSTVIGTSAAGLADGGINNTLIGGSDVRSRNVFGGLATIFNLGAGSGTQILNNYLGTDVSGTINRGGQSIFAGTTNITFGAAGAGNVWDGATGSGFTIRGSGNGWTFKGNRFGTTADGTAPLLGFGGILHTQGNNLAVGGTGAGEGNQFADALDIRSGSNAMVLGNTFGLNAAGTAVLAGSTSSLSFYRFGNATIGDGTAAGRNVFASAGTYGVVNEGFGADGTSIRGNYFGTNASGNALLGSLQYGIWVEASATNTTIDGNVVGKAATAGIFLDGNHTPAALPDRGVAWFPASGNFTNVAGSQQPGAAVGTVTFGTGVAGGQAFQFSRATPGYVMSEHRASYTLNALALTVESWVNVATLPTAGQEYYIGSNNQASDPNYALLLTNTGGATRLGLRYHTTTGSQTVTSAALPFGAGAFHHVAATADGSNIKFYVDGALFDTVAVVGTPVTYGPNTAGDPSVQLFIGGGNSGALTFDGKIDELAVYDRALTLAEINRIFTIGGADKGGSWTRGNTVTGNIVGLLADGVTPGAVAGDGILIDNSESNTIGGTTPAARNIIARAGGDGVKLINTYARFNVIEGNYIGTDVTGAIVKANANGVTIQSGANTNTVGGLTVTPGTGAGNLISGNTGNGITIDGTSGTTASNTVQGNIIGLAAGGTTALGNVQYGVLITRSANNTVGGSAAGARNVLSANTFGVGIVNATATGNVVAGNYVGTDVSGTLDRGNTQDGVVLTNSTTGNTIGGTTAAARNIISGNDLYGVLIQSTSTNNSVQGNYIGTNAGGTSALKNTTDGIRIDNGSSSNTIGGAVAGAGNLISGNGAAGVNIRLASSASNVVAGNTIGLDAAGSPMGNAGDGVTISGNSNTIGGQTSLERNIISGNAVNGVTITGSGITGNVVEGNYIGTNPTGSAAIANAIGVQIDSGASGNTIGGTTAGAANIISGNTGDGVQLTGSGTSNNTIQGNILGLSTPTALVSELFNSFTGGSSAGTQASTGYSLTSGVTLPGWTVTGVAAPTMVGFSGDGLLQVAADTVATQSVGAAANGLGVSYTVGLDIAPTTGADTAAATQSGDGLLIQVLRGDNSVLASYTANAASGWPGYLALQSFSFTYTGDGSGPVRLKLSSATPATGRYAGAVESLLVRPTGVVGNAWGISIVSGASGNTIGGTSQAARNVIDGNTAGGVSIDNAPSNTVVGNFIGVDSTGSVTIPNKGGSSSPGVSITGAAAIGNVVGGTTAGAGNVIAGHSENVVLRFGVTSTLIQGNLIGLNAAGTDALGGISGISVRDASNNNQIGGTSALARNVISGHSDQGIIVSDSDNNLILGNFVGTDLTGLNPVAAVRPQFYGVRVNNANGTIIGGTAAGARNVLGSNSYNIVVDDIHVGLSTNTQISGNLIGIKSSGIGTIDTGTSFGIFDSGSGTLIGGSAAGAGNIIGGSTYGIVANTSGAIVQNNLIGVDQSGAAVGGSRSGVRLVGEQNATVTGNVIGGWLSGVDLDQFAANNTVVGNKIGINVAGTAALPNTTGVVIQGGANHNTIGGTTVGSSNVISGNTGDGVRITGTGTTNNTVLGNTIGLDVNGRGLDDSATLWLRGEGNLTDAVATPGRIIATGLGLTYTAGKVGQAFAFNGNVNSVIQLAPANSGDLSPAQEITVELWVRASSPGAGKVLLSKGFGLGRTSYALTTGATGGLQFTVDLSSSGQVYSPDAGTGVWDGNWHHIAGVYDGSAVRLYVDGSQVGSGTSLGVNLGQTITYGFLDTNNLLIGAGFIPGAIDPSSVFTGALDEITIDNRALEPTGIQAIATAGAAGKGLPLGNRGSGITIGNQARLNLVGGLSATAANLIGGNLGDGVTITDSGTTQNTVEGNWIGLDASGLSAAGNHGDGVKITVSATSNTVGGNTAAARNVIAGQTLSSGDGSSGFGVTILSNGNTVDGNYIGTDPSGTRRLGNWSGVFIGAGNNLIGGPTDDGSGNPSPGAAPGNVISGNYAYGVIISSGDNNVVEGNLIGLAQNGASALSNGVFHVSNSEGIFVDASPSGTIIGSNSASGRNVISGHDTGIQLLSSNTTISGNYIGTNAAGTAALPNYTGISIAGGSGIVVGGLTDDGSGNPNPGAAPGNLISGNSDAGINISSAANVTIEGNLIGTNASGDARIADQWFGISSNSGTNLLIGGSASVRARNIISGNSIAGILLDQGNTLVQGNYIGTDKTGTLAVPNAAGINATGGILTVGGLAGPGSVAGNLISGNTNQGILAFQLDTGVIQGNLIGTDATGTLALPNATGIDLEFPTVHTILVGGDITHRNVISGNTGPGISVAATGVTIAANVIGLNRARNAALGNGVGVSVGAGGDGALVGGGWAFGNTISGNLTNGVVVTSASNVTIQGNAIGTNPTGILALPNLGDGIRLVDARNTLIGGPAEAGQTFLTVSTPFPFALTTVAAADDGTIYTGMPFNGSNGAVYQVDPVSGAVTTLTVPAGINPVALAVLASGKVLVASRRVDQSTNFVILDPAGGAPVTLNPIPADPLMLQATGLAVDAAGNYLVATKSSPTGFGGVYRVDSATGHVVPISVGGVLRVPGSLALAADGSVYVSDNPIGPGVPRVVHIDVNTGVQSIVSAGGLLNNPQGLVALAGGKLVVSQNAVANSLLLVDPASGSQTLLLNSAEVQSGPDLALLPNGELVYANRNVNGVMRVTLQFNANVVSGNAGNGINEADAGSTAENTTIQGNFIGLDWLGRPLGNQGDGVLLGNAIGARIGGTNFLDGNVVSSNAHYGVHVTTGSTGTTILGNLIGLDPLGMSARGNAGAGVYLAQVQNVTVGGSASGAENVISANGASVSPGDGVAYVGTGSSTPVSNVLIEGNLVGLNAAGTAALGNVGSGVSVTSASGVVVGDGAAGGANVISGNLKYGVALNSGGNIVRGNRIGTNPAGSIAIGNALAGVFVNNVANTSIGGVAPGQGNLISGNLADGVLIQGSLATGTTLYGNWIGTDAHGLAAVPNQGAGVHITDASGTILGGAMTGGRNLLSGNAGAGVRLDSTGVYAGTGNTIQGNWIGVNATGMGAVPNLIGIQSLIGLTTIGGAITGQGNLISGNLQSGIVLLAANNIVLGNLIGVDVTAAGPLGNGGDGVTIGSAALDASNNQIGAIDPTKNPRNIIAYQNSGAGVRVVRGTGNRVRGNALFGNNTTFGGIDLDPSVSTPNALRPAPVVASATRNASAHTVTISGSVSLGSLLAGRIVLIDVYSNRGVNGAPQAGEGRDYVGTVTVTLDASGNAVWTLANIPEPAQDHFYSATETVAADNNTSPLSAQRALSNLPPVAVIAGSGITIDPHTGAKSLNVTEGQPFALDASGSYDPNGDPIVQYQWSDTTGQTQSSPKVKWVFPDNPPAGGTYTVTLRVFDGLDWSNDTLSVHVQNVAPAFVGTSFGPGQPLAPAGAGVSMGHRSGYGAAVAGVVVDDGDAIAVSAPFGVTGNGSGLVYYYDQSTGGLITTFQSPALPGGLPDAFGTALASLGNLLVITAPGVAGASLPYPGAVYLFDAQPPAAGVKPGASTFGHVLKTWSDPNPTPGDGFGNAVTTVGTNIVVSAPGANNGRGALYVYDGNPASTTFGQQLATINDPAANPGDHFGYALASSGYQLYASAPNGGTAPGDDGLVYQFDVNRLLAGLSYTVHVLHNPAGQYQARSDPTGATCTGFGSSLAAVGSLVAVGSPCSATSSRGRRSTEGQGRSSSTTRPRTRRPTRSTRRTTSHPLRRASAARSPAARASARRSPAVRPACSSARRTTVSASPARARRTSSTRPTPPAPRSPTPCRNPRSTPATASAWPWDLSSRTSSSARRIR
ncbi:MAG: LamG-like jellyroll fold domain-containing protein [Isosphaeraceae bacterium]